MRLTGIIPTVLAFVVFALSGPATAETVKNGGDTFFAGKVLSETISTGGDTFMSARSVSARGAAQGDLHVQGFDVSVNADVAEDLYAIGATVVVRGTVASDLTAAGFSVRTERGAATAGNARLAGNSVTIEGPVAGALTVAGRDVILNAAVDGDMQVLAGSLSFGPDAVVGGTLTYRSGDKISVPERVAPAGRVVFERFTAGEGWDDLKDIREDMPVLPTFASVFMTFIISLLFFLVLGALMLGFMPRRLENLRQHVASAPGQAMLLGVLGLSVLFGMVPITALTIIGLPFVPVAVLCIVLAWTLGYALGAYSVAMHLWRALGGQDTPGNALRLAIFAVAICVIALLNFIPFVGWVANYTLVLLGIGAMTKALFLFLLGNPGQALDVDMKPVEE